MSHTGPCAVGGVVGQLARILGCRAVGIAGGAAKCAHVVETLGFDACVDYKGGRLHEDLKAACPDGIDVYFDNVGSWITDAVLPLVNFKARIAICGMIAEYNLEKPELAPRITRHLLVNSARMEGFIILNFRQRFGEGLREMSGWVKSGQLKYREDVVDGLENAPRALLRLFKGENFGKQLVRIRPDPTRR